MLEEADVGETYYMSPSGCISNHEGHQCGTFEADKSRIRFDVDPGQGPLESTILFESNSSRAAGHRATTCTSLNNMICNSIGESVKGVDVLSGMSSTACKEEEKTALLVDHTGMPIWRVGMHSLKVRTLLARTLHGDSEAQLAPSRMFKLMPNGKVLDSVGQIFGVFNISAGEIEPIEQKMSSLPGEIEQHAVAQEHGDMDKEHRAVRMPSMQMSSCR